jgi:ABC-type transporter Mla subunit MlaD
MAVPIPRPRAVVSVVRQGFQAIEWTIMLVPRIAALISEIEMIAARISTVLNQVELTERRISSVVAGIEQTQERVVAVVTRVSQTATAIDVIVAEAALLTRRAAPLLDAYQQPLEQLQPIVARLSETTSPAEVDAMVALLDTLPNIAYKLDRDVLPVLDTLGTVAPDLRDLLDVSKQLNVMLSAIPGLGRIKKQIDERQEQDDAYRADAEPPSAPDRSG